MFNPETDLPPFYEPQTDPALTKEKQDIIRGGQLPPSNRDIFEVLADAVAAYGQDNAVLHTREWQITSDFEAFTLMPARHMGEHAEQSSAFENNEGIYLFNLDQRGAVKLEKVNKKDTPQMPDYVPILEGEYAVALRKRILQVIYDASNAAQ